MVCREFVCLLVNEGLLRNEGDRVEGEREEVSKKGK
jgi:hypothetical protein